MDKALGIPLVTATITIIIEITLIITDTILYIYIADILYF